MKMPHCQPEMMRMRLLLPAQEQLLLLLALQAAFQPHLQRLVLPRQLPSHQ